MFDGMISPHLLPSKHAMPQGDPLSPLILTIWVSAGLRCTEAEQSNQSPQTVQYAAYMDDRSFWCATWEGVQARISSWNTWSQVMASEKIQAKPKLLVVLSLIRRCFGMGAPKILKILSPS